MDCSHKNLVCLNHYETFRKYLCHDCGQVFICECEKKLGLEFLPYQLTFGTEYGTQKRYLVTAFAPNICATCRGDKEEAHPRAYCGKVERYYWREIYKTYLAMVSEWLNHENVAVKDILGFEHRFPGQAKRMKKEAQTIWQKHHKEKPKYIVNEPSEADFFSEVKVPVRYLSAKHIEIKEKRKKIGKWINQEGKSCSVEEAVADWYRTKGFSVRRCETRLISILVGTFCAPVILGHEKSIGNALNSGFGSQQFFRSKSDDFQELISKLERQKGLQAAFEDLLYPSKGLRIYLGVDDEEAVELGRTALRVMPQSLVLECVKWGFQYFWGRRAGWPDLFAFDSGSFLFIEVKSPTDKLSLEQMNWFRWAVKEVNMPCELVRVQKDSEIRKEKQAQECPK